MIHIDTMDKRLLAYVNVFLLSNRLQAVMDKGMEELTGKQWLALTMLLNFKEAPTLKQIAIRMGVSHQSARQIVGQLEKRGFVTVEHDKEDARAIRIIRTEQADLIRRRDTARNHDFVMELFSVLTDEEVQEFYESQKKLCDKLVDMKEWGADE